MITSSIVTYKSDRKELDTLIDCILNSPIDRIYIIDNSPTDELRYYGRLSDKIEYNFGQGNIGYGAAHNIAIRKSIELGAKYHVVINPDIQFDRGVIESLASYMDTNLNVGQVMPKVIYPDGELQYLCKLIPTPIDLIFKRFIPSVLIKKRVDKFQLKFTDYKDPMNVPYLSGCFMFFRIYALKKIGLFDERFFMYPEDIDITRRMNKCYKTVFYPDVTIIHAHAAESYKSKKMLWIHISNMIKYFNKWGWFFDKERKAINKKTLKELNFK